MLSAPSFDSMLTRFIRRVGILFVVFCAGQGLWGETPQGGGPSTRSFDIPAAEAQVALKKFAQQSGLELLYSTREIVGITTNAVKGVFTAQEALHHLLDGTKLIATPGRNRGAVAVTRAPDPNG